MGLDAEKAIFLDAEFEVGVVGGNGDGVGVEGFFFAAGHLAQVAVALGQFVGVLGGGVVELAPGDGAGVAQCIVGIGAVNVFIAIGDAVVVGIALLAEEAEVCPA